ncbi:DUF1295 domain-containing protein [Candidatus Gracilibacteria bacterium]|nr:DUF1295 domain-containing protein [Candidatus Gracilibacteria bacterium]
MDTKIKNYFSTMSFILLGYLFYTHIPYYQNFFHGEFSLIFFPNFSLKSEDLFIFIVLSYAILLIPFYIFHSEKGKALIVIEYIIKKIKNFSYKINHQEKLSILAWGVKLFYAPLMIFWFSGHISTMINNLYLTYGNRTLFSHNFYDFFNQNLFWTAFSFILFFDVFFFTCGYLIESPFLKNTIKSVEPTFLGWFVALACYPPFNGMIGNIIPWYSSDFPEFSHHSLHIFFNSLLLICMAIYSSASFALGWKASNLTNRGIVKNGIYKYVRHPAYIAKNTAWWIGCLPVLIDSFQIGNWKLFFIVIFCMSFWTFLYFMRAITEERHLSRDSDYEQYKKEVPYRFIPNVY